MNHQIIICDCGQDFQPISQDEQLCPLCQLAENSPFRPIQSWPPVWPILGAGFFSYGSHDPNAVLRFIPLAGQDPVDISIADALEIIQANQNNS